MGKKISILLFLILSCNILLSPKILLAEIKKSHGELVFSNTRLQEIKTNPTYNELKNNFLSAAKSQLASSPARVLDPRKNYCCYQQILENLTMAYLLTDDSAYLDKTIEYIKAVTDYESWGAWWGGPDLQISSFIMGMAFSYDYLYDQLDQALKTSLENKLLKEMHDLFYKKSYLFDLKNESSGYLLGNHTWIANISIYTGTVALRDKIPEVEKNEYLTRTDEILVNKIVPLLPKDGTGQEKASYSLYGLYYMLRFMETKKINENINLYDSAPYFRSIMYYTKSMVLPNEINYVCSGDSPSDHMRFTPRAFALRLASEFGDGLIQDFGISFNGFPEKYDLDRLFWYDPQVKPISGTDSFLRISYFPVGGETSYRTSWDKDALMFYCCSGKLRTGHDHPDQGQFIISYKNTPLLIDQGYTYWKTTQEHNTLLVDDYGQIGENNIWFPSDRGEGLCDTVDFFKDQEGNYLHLTEDITRAYRPQCGITKYLRHLAVIEKYFFIIDEAKTSRPKHYEIRFHAGDTAKIQDSNNSFSSIEPHHTILSAKDARVLFFLDRNKNTSVEPTYYLPKSYPGRTTQELFDYVKKYHDTNKHAIDRMTTKQVFADFTKDGFAPVQRGYHLSQKTPQKTTHAIFKNLLVVQDKEEASPSVLDIDTGSLIGYEVSDPKQKIVLLFNKTDDMETSLSYKGLSFKGKMVCAVYDIRSGPWHYYTKRAQILSEFAPTILMDK